MLRNLRRCRLIRNVGYIALFVYKTWFLWKLCNVIEITYLFCKYPNVGGFQLNIIYVRSKKRSYAFTVSVCSCASNVALITSVNSPICFSNVVIIAILLRSVIIAVNIASHVLLSYVILLLSCRQITIVFNGITSVKYSITVSRNVHILVDIHKPI